MQAREQIGRFGLAASPTVSVAVTRGLLDRIVAAGGDPDQILRTAGLQRSLLARPDGLIPTSAFACVLNEAARATGDDCFGLRFGEQFDPKDVGVLVYVVLNSPTFSDAVENLVRYIHIHNRGVIARFDVEGGLGYMRYVLGDPGLEIWRQHNEFSMAVVLGCFRIMAGAQSIPHSIEFAHEAPAEISEHARVFGCRVKFHCAWNALVFEKKYLERMATLADTKLYELLKPHVERVLADIPRETDLLAKARRAIVEYMAKGSPTLRSVATELAVSPRSLERRLKGHGVVFKDLVREMRKRLALDYLRDDRHSLAEIAFLLGYSEVSAFNRAFKRWTGSSPSRYRLGPAKSSR